MSVVPDTGPHETVNWRTISYCGRAATAESGEVRSTMVHDWFPEDGVCTFPAQSVPMDRNWYVWPSWAPVYVPEVVVTGTVTQSVHAPLLSLTWIRNVAVSVDSELHWTKKLDDVCQTGRGSVRVKGANVSTIVHVSFALGPASVFPAMSSATVANSYTPSPLAVKEKNPNGCAGWVANGIHPPPFHL